MLSWRSANDHHAMFCPWHILPRLTSEAETLCGKDLDIEHLQLWVLSMAVVRAWSLQRRWRKPVLPCFSHMKVPAGWFPSGSLGGRPLRQRPTLPRGPPPPRPPSVSRTRGADAKKTVCHVGGIGKPWKWNLRNCSPQGGSQRPQSALKSATAPSKSPGCTGRS
jgi:hypothetical protein